MNKDNPAPVNVYAIHEGCKFEGGGVTEIYSNKEDAIKSALITLEEKKKEVLSVHEDDPKRWEWNEIKANRTDIIKIWQNPVDELIVYEYELK